MSSNVSVVHPLVLYVPSYSANARRWMSSIAEKSSSMAIRMRSMADSPRFVKRTCPSWQNLHHRLGCEQGQIEVAESCIGFIFCAGRSELNDDAIALICRYLVQDVVCLLVGVAGKIHLGDERPEIAM